MLKNSKNFNYQRFKKINCLTLYNRIEEKKMLMKFKKFFQ